MPESGTSIESLPGQWIDVSVMLHKGLAVWPENAPIVIELDKELGKDYHANLSVLNLGAHSGTHMDAPLHFIKGGPGLETMPLDATVGRARVIEIENAEEITIEELRQYDFKKGERILFKTFNSERNWPEQSFLPDAVYVATDAAEMLADAGVRTVGIDYLSVGGYKKNGVEVHNILLSSGVWIIEGLYLADIAPGDYDLICLPVKILGSDGAPARAILRPLATS
jgi:arylformamidase